MKPYLRIIQLTVLYFIALSSVYSQSSTLLINGSVNDLKELPVPSKEVNIMLSGAGHSNNVVLYTDSLGQFGDTIQFPSSQGIVLIYVIDCEDGVQELLFEAHDGVNIQAHFEICYEDPDYCIADFYFVKDSLNGFKYSFFDNSTASSPIQTRQWVFSGNTYTSIKNPQFIFPDTGRYSVCLTVYPVQGPNSTHCDTVTVNEDTSYCNADFYFQKLTTSGIDNYYQFFDNSKPQDHITSYHWDFDDGNTSSQQSPSHQFMQKGAYSVNLSIYTNNGCHSEHEHRFFIEDDADGTCNADFSYEEDTTTASVKDFLFYDQSSFVNGPVIGYYWDFGDGSTSLAQNPTHSFPKVGIYNVSLTILTMDSCVSTRKKKVTVGSPSYHLLGGQVFHNSFPIDVFDAILYRDINNYLEPVDTSRFDTLGYFYFIEVIQGDYKVKIFPADHSSYSHITVPTYYDKELFWDQSLSMPLTNNVFSMDVNLVDYSNLQGTGPGSISGFLHYDTTGSLMNYPPGKQFNLTKREVVVKEEVSSQVVAHTYTANNGAFTVSDLPFGQYLVYADYPGKYCDPVHLTLDNNNSSVDSVILEVKNDKISGYILNRKPHNNTIGDAFPNPVSNDKVMVPVNLASPGSVDMVLYSVCGKRMKEMRYNMDAGEGIMRVNLQGLPKGVFFLEAILADNEGVRRQKVIIL